MEYSDDTGEKEKRSAQWIDNQARTAAQLVSAHIREILQTGSNAVGGWVVCIQEHTHALHTPTCAGFDFKRETGLR